MTSIIESVATITLADLEKVIRRVVKEAVHEEFVQMSRCSTPSVADDWSHEGPEDPAGDEALLAEALVMIEQYELNPRPWKTLGKLEAELVVRQGSYDGP